MAQKVAMSKEDKVMEEEKVSMKDYVDSQITSIKEAISEARRVMEMRMEGFPQQFAKVDEMAATSRDLTDLKDRNLKELREAVSNKPSQKDIEFAFQTLSSRLDAQEKRIGTAETLKLYVSGRIWSLGFVLFVIIVLIEVAIKFVIH